MPRRTGLRRSSRDLSSRSPSAALSISPFTAGDNARARLDAAAERCHQTVNFLESTLAFGVDRRIYRGLDALARAYGPWWLCNDVTRPFWSSGRKVGPEREVVWLLSDSGAWCPALMPIFAEHVCAGGATGSS